MQLFHWHSDALKNYARGHILVMAPNVAQARDLVRAEGRRWLRENRHWWFDADGALDPDEAEEHAEWWTKLELDIAAEPAVDPVWLIAGGE